MSLAKRWCFTLNNPTDDEQHDFYTFGEAIGADGDQSVFTYLVFGDEVGDGGTPHLQGYLCLREKKRLSYLKSLPSFGRCHLEVARGTHKQASDYCKKGGSYHEWGTPPKAPGNGAQFEELRNWVAAQEVAPSTVDVWEAFPSLAARYPRAVQECIELFGKRPALVEGELRLWQRRLDSIVSGPADDRRVVFVIDPAGNSGKSWLTRYWMSHRPGTQFLSVGKRDDLAYAVDARNDLFVFDIPRGNLQYLQYGLLEQLKNRLVFSTKYMSQCKRFDNNVHVVIFTNEHPDMEALTGDRYKLIELNE